MKSPGESSVRVEGSIERPAGVAARAEQAQWRDAVGSVAHDGRDSANRSSSMSNRRRSGRKPARRWWSAAPGRVDELGPDKALPLVCAPSAARHGLCDRGASGSSTSVATRSSRWPATTSAAFAPPCAGSRSLASDADRGPRDRQPRALFAAPYHRAEAARISLRPPKRPDKALDWRSPARHPGGEHRHDRAAGRPRRATLHGRRAGPRAGRLRQRSPGGGRVAGLSPMFRPCRPRAGATRERAGPRRTPPSAP